MLDRFVKHLIMFSCNHKSCHFSKLATSGNRTRASRVAGENSTTEPTLLGDSNPQLIYISNLIDWYTIQIDSFNLSNSKYN